MCNGRHRYYIDHIPGEMQNWMSYSGEGCSLLFHIPPVFQGLVVWVAHCHYCYYQIIIKNKSNGIQLFKDKLEHPLPKPEGWIRYISRSEMAMEEGYCGDEELELYIYSRKSDSFDESKVGRDIVMSSPPPYHLLPHPHCGSITASTLKQWSDYLFSKLQKHNLHLTIYGKNKYFL